jgi:uncharacterized tellurite resistance protein B-like protein
MENIFSKEIMQACSGLLINVADADNIIESDELNAIQDILKDFFAIDDVAAQNLIDHSLHEINMNKDLFSAGKYLIDTFTAEEKIDFLHCIYEVGYSDGSLHHIEEHMIKQIANILHIEHKDIVNANIEVKGWFKEDK